MGFQVYWIGGPERVTSGRRFAFFKRDNRVFQLRKTRLLLLVLRVRGESHRIEEL